MRPHAPHVRDKANAHSRRGILVGIHTYYPQALEVYRLATLPNVFVAKTHRRKRLRHLWPKRRLDDVDVERAYGRDAVLFLQGKAGDGFVEDTFGLHKGVIPISKRRLVLQLEYGTSRDECRVDQHDPALFKRIDL